MPRTARHKSSEAASYHLMTRVAGSPRFFPLQSPLARGKLTETIRFYVSAYRCRMFAFEILDNHYHLIVHFEKFRDLTPLQLEQAAASLYGKRWKTKTTNWDRRRWRSLNQRLFDVSALMQHLNGEYAKWFNREHGRRGHLWGGRFKNPQLTDLYATQECLLYVELNALRAGLVTRPEQWEAGSAHWRAKGQGDSFLAPLQELFPATQQHSSFEIYRARLYSRGGVTARDNPAAILTELPCQEQEGGLRPGLFRSRIRFFTDGVVIGSRAAVSDSIDGFRRQGLYRRRKHPISQLKGQLFTLREQRSHAF